MSQIIREMAKEKKKEGFRQKNAGVWLYPTAIEREYTRLIRRVFLPFVSVVIKDIKPLLASWVRENRRRDAWSDDLDEVNKDYRALQREVFDENEKELREEILAIAILIARFNKTQQVKFVSGSLGVDRGVVSGVLGSEPWLDPLLQAWTTNNVNLIKGLTDEYYKKINNAVITGLQNDSSAKNLAKELTKINKNFARSRTKLIARDQTNKLNGVLVQRRQEDVGIEWYWWETARDEAVRKPKHSNMQSKICKWSDATVYANSIEDAKAGKWLQRSSLPGVLLHPGGDIQCRCWANGIFTELL